jgi:hypothetical protein
VERRQRQLTGSARDRKTAPARGRFLSGPGMRLARGASYASHPRHARNTAKPTLILFRGGREVARQSGAMAGAQIAKWVRQHAV